MYVHIDTYVCMSLYMRARGRVFIRGEDDNKVIHGELHLLFTCFHSTHNITG